MSIKLHIINYTMHEYENIVANMNECSLAGLNLKHMNTCIPMPSVILTVRGMHCDGALYRLGRKEDSVL